MPRGRPPKVDHIREGFLYQIEVARSLESAVRPLAEVFFATGAPFKSPLAREADRLKQAAKVRNRVAHASEKCKMDFRQAANSIMQRPPTTSLGQGFRVGELLSEAAGAFFGAHVPALNITVFEAYMGVYTRLAGEIVPH